jgi:hypothetical protein
VAFVTLISFLLVSFALGIIVGVLTKGIKITIHHKQEKEETPIEYNPSSAKHLPKEMLDYAEQNQGYIKF